MRPSHCPTVLILSRQKMPQEYCWLEPPYAYAQHHDLWHVSRIKIGPRILEIPVTSSCLTRLRSLPDQAPFIVLPCSTVERKLADKFIGRLVLSRFWQGCKGL